MNKAAREIPINSPIRSSEITCSIEKMAVESFNDSVGELKGYYCAICKNKGMVAELIDGQDYYKPVSYTHLDVYKRQVLHYCLQ